MARRTIVWLHALDSLVRIELDTAERFFRFSELRFQREREKLDIEYKKHPKSYWNEDLDLGTTRRDLLSDEYSEIREMQRLNRYFGVILVYSVFERLLHAIYRDAKHLRLVKDKRVAAKPNLDFRGYIQVLKRDLRIDLIARKEHYAEINKLRTIRNLIAHGAGWVHSQPPQILRRHGFKEHQQIELVEEYFFEIRALIKTEASFVVDSYREFLLANKIV
jgi:hypothetical protein